MNQAICVLNFTDNRKGTIYFYSEYGKINMLILLKNIGLHYGKLKGLHIHECGDLTNGCLSACAHYNPSNEIHGGLNSKHRHYGDFGNIKLDDNGNCQIHLTDIPVTIRDIVGRSVVLHEAEDDLGKGKRRYINKLEDINNTLLSFLQNNNDDICNQIMGNHEMLSEELENHIRQDLIQLRKYESDKIINKLVYKINDFVISKVNESKKTGNSGKRIGCGVIGYCEKKNPEDLISKFFY